REDDAGRAVRAALELTQAVPELGRAVGADLQARAGVHTGEAAVNLAAKGQGMVAGDTVNTASRLQSSAEPGTALVDRATYLGARNAIAFQEAGRLSLKGKDEPVEAWRPLRVIAGLGGFKQADSLEPAFTGRDEELRQIKDLLHVAGRERKPRLASVIGIGGIGKSRLVWEFFKYIDGLSDFLEWHQGRSPSYGDGVAFWALAEMVRMRARIAETDDDATASAKLDKCFVDYSIAEDEREWLKPYLAYLLGLEGGSEGTREQLFAAWRTFFERVAEAGTCIMIFEDLHWADPGLIDFIEHLMAWARSSPILILTLARPELLEKRPNWGAGQRNFTSIHLEPLGEDDMKLLLKSVAADLPAEVRENVIERAEGVPLYAVEMVRMLIDRGHLVPDGDEFAWIGEASHIDVPDSLHSLIASRLDALSTQDRLLVQDASILGKTFTTPSLEAVTGMPAEQLEPSLADLVRREIFLVDTDPRSPERGQYGFVQSLIREVAYQTLSNENRRDRHVAAAEYFESTNEPDVIDVIATHYMEAYNNARKDDESSAQLAERARAALVEASERATSLGSSAQAQSLLEKALGIAGDGPDRGEILYLAGRAAYNAGRMDTAVGHLTEAIELLPKGDDLERRARAQATLGQTLFLSSRPDEAIEMLEGALTEIPDDLSPAAAHLFSELARVSYFAGDPEKSQYYSDRAMPAAERAGNIAVIADCLITRGVAGLFAGRSYEAEVLLMGALRLSEQHDLVVQRLRAFGNLSANHMLIHPSKGFNTAKEGLEIALRYGAASHVAVLLSNGIESATHLGEWDWARGSMAEMSESLHDYSAVVLSIFAGMEALAGNLRAAEKHLAAFADFIGDSSSVQDQSELAAYSAVIAFVKGDFEGVRASVAAGTEAGVHVMLEPFGVVGRTAVWSGDLDEARAELHRLERSVLQNDWKNSRMRTLVAGIQALEGDRDGAIESFRGVLQEWDALSIPLDKALCQMDFAITVGGSESAEAAAEAERFFAEVGNDYFLERLRAARFAEQPV
ncbi:MAG: hypothetical protein QOH26_1721, partial [Actinomycetota bacterium]|nr:hypothetical protein [Actinomycetota bacterium]